MSKPYAKTNFMVIINSLYKDYEDFKYKKGKKRNVINKSLKHNNYKVNDELIVDLFNIILKEIDFKNNLLTINDVYISNDYNILFNGDGVFERNCYNNYFYYFDFFDASFSDFLYFSFSPEFNKEYIIKELKYKSFLCGVDSFVIEYIEKFVNVNRMDFLINITFDSLDDCSISIFPLLFFNTTSDFSFVIFPFCLYCDVVYYNGFSDEKIKKFYKKINRNREIKENINLSLKRLFINEDFFSWLLFNYFSLFSKRKNNKVLNSLRKLFEVNFSFDDIINDLNNYKKFFLDVFNTEHEKQKNLKIEYEKRRELLYLDYSINYIKMNLSEKVIINNLFIDFIRIFNLFTKSEPYFFTDDKLNEFKKTSIIYKYFFNMFFINSSFLYFDLEEMFSIIEGSYEIKNINDKKSIKILEKMSFPYLYKKSKNLK